MRRGLALVLACLAAAPAVAAGFSLCFDENPHPPYSYKSREGAVEILLRMVQAQTGVTFTIKRAPLKRCQESLVAGQFDGFPVVSELFRLDKAELVFPMVNGRLDPTRATGEIRRTVYRRRGGTAEWDGFRFQHLERPVLFSGGQVAVREKLNAMGQPYDDGARSSEINFAKLLAHRGDVAIEMTSDGTILLRDPRFANQIEAMPTPFSIERFYFVLTPAAYQRDKAAAEAVWTAIAKVRADPAYHAAVRDLPAE